MQIAPRRARPRYPQNRFEEQAVVRARFEDKGRFTGYMARIPTLVITRDQPAFLGLSSLLDA